MREEILDEHVCAINAEGGRERLEGLRCRMKQPRASRMMASCR
jgi:hypothetical protein